MMFDFVFDRHMPINDHMVFNLRLHASLSTKVRKCIFPLMDLKKMFLLQVMYMIILGRLAQFHSEFFFWCVMLQWAQGTAKTWKLGEVFDVMHFLQVTKETNFKGGLWLVMLFRWCVKNVIWNITLEWPQINEWKSPCLSFFWKYWHRCP